MGKGEVDRGQVGMFRSKLFHAFLWEREDILELL